MPDALPFRLAALALGLAAALPFGPAAAKEKDPFTMVSIEEVERMLGQPDVAIVDANPRDVFRKNHLPGATHYKSAPFAKVLPPDKERRIVFYCASPT